MLQIWSIYLFGCSGSGKTSQANKLVSFLSERLGSCILLDMGQHIRDEIKRDSHLLTPQDREALQRGRYITDDTIHKMVVPQLKAVPKETRGRVIVGWPRTPPQGQHMILMARSSQVVECSMGFIIDVPIHVCLERMGGQDDRDETTKTSDARNQRVAEWKNFTVPTIQILKNNMTILSVNGSAAKDVVAMEIRSKLVPHLPQPEAPAHEAPPLNPMDIPQAPL